MRIASVTLHYSLRSKKWIVGTRRARLMHVQKVAKRNRKKEKKSIEERINGINDAIEDIIRVE